MTSYNYKTKFSLEQIIAADKILQSTNEDRDDEHMYAVRQMLLVAPIQSGKTGCYMLTACEMLYQNKVKKCVIISGMPDKELEAQTMKHKKTAIMKLRYILLNEREMEQEEVETKLSEIEENIVICWGVEIHKYKDDISDTCFFIDESHYAQNKEMKIDKFFGKHGIRLNGGNWELLNDKNTYIITVSATPFSEICNIHHQHQPKQIIFLKPDAEAGYLGLGEFWRNGQIIGFDTSVSSITKLVTNIASEIRTNQVKKYGIIRCSSVSGGKDPEDVRLIESVKEIAKRYGIHTVEYDSESKKNKSSEIKSFQNLEKEPAVPTWILVKGMGRCGHNVPKKYIDFVMETSKDALFCTILQALLGRMFGYDSNDSIKVYLPNKIVESGDIQTVIDFYEKQAFDCIPNNARNIIPERQCRRKRVISDKPTGSPIFPIQITNLPEYSVFSKLKKEDMKKRVIDHVSENYVDTKNDTETMDDLYAQLQDPETKLTISKIPNKTYLQVPKLINKANTLGGVPVALGPGCGSLYKSFRLFIFESDMDGFHKGDVFLDGRTRIAPRTRNVIPKTTRYEMYSYSEDD